VNPGSFDVNPTGDEMHGMELRKNDAGQEFTIDATDVSKVKSIEKLLPKLDGNNLPPILMMKDKDSFKIKASETMHWMKRELTEKD